MSQSVLDSLLAAHTFTCQIQPVVVSPEEIVHVVGTQEPFQSHSEERARTLIKLGWLKIEHVRTELPEAAMSDVVTELQQSARAWLKQAGSEKPSDRDQVRWLVEKTRPYESKQQIVHRVWLTVVLYNLGFRGINFNKEGEILWEGGMTGRIGLGADDAIDLAWGQTSHQVFTASFRYPDGTIARGKGRNRWYIYRLTVDSEAAFLFERRTKQVSETVALIVASETYATQPQLPRNFYGGDAFQQACIDAQDQQFDHILVLSPEHGVISLDDVVPSEQSWDEVLERRLWVWQLLAIQRLGTYLFGDLKPDLRRSRDLNWWAWLHPRSIYELTVFGSGFPARILFDYIYRSQLHSPSNLPGIFLLDPRMGYDAGDLDDDYTFMYEHQQSRERQMYAEMYGEDDDEDDEDEPEVLRDIDMLLDWAGEFVTLVTIFVPPTGETWELAPDEALIPVRLLTDTGMDIEDLLDLLTDMTLLLEQPISFNMLINANMLVSLLLQITHSLVHNERDAIREPIEAFQDAGLRQYIEKVMQEPSYEDQLCACLTLTEQVQLLALTISPALSDQLLVWLQTYLSSRMRHRILGEMDQSPD